MSELLRFDVCCNDHGDGSFASRASALSLPDDLLELGAYDERGPVFRDFGHSLRLGRRLFPYERSKEWYGNWSWNAYWLKAPDAIELLAWVHAQAIFYVDGGHTWLFDRWERRRPFDVDDREQLGNVWAIAMGARS